MTGSKLTASYPLPGLADISRKHQMERPTSRSASARPLIATGSWFARCQVAMVPERSDEPNDSRSSEGLNRRDSSGSSARHWQLYPVSRTATLTEAHDGANAAEGETPRT